MKILKNILEFIEELQYKGILIEPDDKTNYLYLNCNIDLFQKFPIETIFSYFETNNDNCLVIRINKTTYIFEEIEILKTRLKSLEPNDKLTLKVKKDPILISILGDSKNNKKVFFKTQTYIDWINKFDLNNISKTFENERNFIILLDQKNTFISNSHISIVGLDSLSKIEENSSVNIQHIENQIKNHKKNCNNRVCDSISPGVFYFKNLSDSSILFVKKFDDIFMNLTLSYFSNLTDSNSLDNSISEFEIYGYKNISIESSEVLFKNIEDRNRKIKTLYELYKWVYSSSYNPDKLRILQYVISIQLENECSTKDFIESLEYIYSSAENSYDQHIEKQVNYFFEDKNRIQLEIYQRVRDFNKEFDKLSNLLRNNIISLLGIFPPIFLSLILKNQPPVKFIEYFIIGFIMALIGFTSYNIYYISKNINYINTLYQKFKTHTKQFLTKGIAKEIFNIKDDIDLFDQRVKSFKIARVINCLVLVIIVIILFNIHQNIDYFLNDVIIK